MNTKILESSLLKDNSTEHKNLGNIYCCFFNVDDLCLWWFFHNSCNVIKNEEQNNNVYCKYLNCCNDCLELRFNKLCNKEITIYCCLCTLYYIN